ncbi:AI-2E family transporter [Candidatus Uhrbacteria bacterium]|nr:AI-2E family transporter [Candidatus Uhrbacteria bacterium]
MSRFEHQTTTINVSTQSFVKVLIILALVVFLYQIRDVLAIIFVALILSSAFSPLVGSLEKRGIPRLFGILFIYLFVVSLFALAITLVIPPIVQEYSQLAARFPVYSERIIALVNDYYPEVDVVEQFKTFLSGIQSSLLSSVSGIFARIFSIVEGFIAFMLIFVVTFYLIMEENALKKAVSLVSPPHFRPFIDEITGKVQKKIGLWLRAQVTLSFIIFAVTFLVLTLLGVDYALTLAVVAGLTEFMPIIGPFIASIPAVFIALGQSPLLALWVALLYICVQYAENHFIVPRVMQKTVGINPLISIIALMIGGKIGGIPGILLAIPVATVVVTLLEEFIGPEEILEAGQGEIDAALSKR